MSALSAALSGLGLPWPKNLIFCLIFSIIALASVGFLLLESQAEAERREGRDRRERGNAEAITEMRQQIGKMYAEKFERESSNLAITTTSKLPEALRKFTLELSSEILRFVLGRDATAITPAQAYAERGQDWQSLYWPRLGDHYRESFDLYARQYEKQVEELYRQIVRHGTGDPELERAMREKRWPVDMYTVAERLGQLAEGLP